MSSKDYYISDQDTMIEIRRLSKRYEIYKDPKDRLKQSLLGRHRKYYREFWALKNVSFGIRKGQSLGIIGRNGSGKSTLLQLICGTLTPTEGEVVVNGRIAALLELGSGFNPEFTGLENVYLNAALLGLAKNETDARLDNILAFADIGDFIYQPIKTYSSGMAVRLAFAISTNVSADILIVDEALSVGDQPFQQKCFDQLRRFRESGGTSILVSHDNFSIKRFCDSAIWLRNGEVIESGNSGTVVDKYRDWCDSIEGVSYSKEKCLGRNLDEIDKTEKIGTTNTRIIHSDEILEVDSHGIEVLEENGDNSIRQLSKCILSFTIANKGLGLGRNIRLGFWLRDSKAVEICGSNTLQELGDLVAPMKGESVDIIFKFALPAIPPGFYSIRFNIDARHTGEDKLDKWETLVLVDSCLPFTVELDKSMLDRPMGLLGLPCSVYAEQRSTKA